jgi:hypothetical protein
MILITHANLKALSGSYSNEIYSKFLDRKKIIEKVLDNLECADECSFKGYNIKECLSAFKVIVSIKNLDKPEPRLKTDEILHHYINQIRQRNTDSDKGQINIDIIRARLEAIFSFDLKSLFSADIDQLKSYNDEFSKIVQSEKINKELQDFFFDYTKYYAILNKYIGSELGIICCPYCNRNYISYVFSAKNKRIIGPTYDHFFNKKDYYFISLSFFNLIPSCTVCNSNLKHQINFDLKTHLYPYKDEFGTNAVFDFDLSLLESGEEDKIIFKPFIRIKEGISDENKLKLTGMEKDSGKEVSGNIKVFKLQEIYATHYDTVEEVHEKFDANNKFYIASIKDNLKRMGTGEEEFYRYHFNNYFDSRDFHKRPLAKLSRDIYDKMKMLQDIGATTL